MKYTREQLSKDASNLRRVLRAIEQLSDYYGGDPMAMARRIGQINGLASSCSKLGLTLESFAEAGEEAVAAYRDEARQAVTP